MRWKWLTEKEYRSEAGQRRVNDPRFLDPTFPASFRRCFQVKEGNLDVVGVISKVEKQLIVGGILDENPDALRLSLRFHHRLMWLWGFHSGWIGVPCGSLSGLAVSDGGFFQEGNPVGKRKKSGRCREGACRIEWEKDEERTGVGVLRCQIDPQLQIHRLEARILTYKQAEVARRGEAIAQIHHWNQLANKAGTPIDAGGLRFVWIGEEAWISTQLPSAYCADYEYLRDQLAKQLTQWGKVLRPDPEVEWIPCRRRLFMPV